MARIGHALVRVGIGVPEDGERRALDRDGAAQAVHRQAPGERIRLVRLAIDEHVVAVRPEEEVEQRLSLRRQQRAESLEMDPHRAARLTGKCSRPMKPMSATEYCSARKQREGLVRAK